MIPADWQKWVILSCNNHVKNSLDPSGVFVHLEGFPRNLEDKDEWFEVRVDVPNSIEQSKDDFKLEVMIDILCVVEIPKNAYRIHELVGIAQSALSDVINIINGVETFKEFLVRDPFDQTRVSVFNTKNKATGSRLASVEAKYRLYMES